MMQYKNIREIVDENNNTKKAMVLIIKLNNNVLKDSNVSTEKSVCSIKLKYPDNIKTDRKNLLYSLL